ncbi:hypothetical protein LJR118_001802 [Acidovorax sp. LjRoot118]
MRKTLFIFIAAISLSSTVSAHIYKCKDKNGVWKEEACHDYEQRRQQEGRKILDEAARKNWTPQIGMTATEIEKTLRSSTCLEMRVRHWCPPWKVNTTKTALGTREQWVWSDGNGMPVWFMYFNNGVLVSIQE